MFHFLKKEEGLQRTDLTQPNAEVCERCGIELRLLEKKRIVTLEGKPYCDRCAEYVTASASAPKEVCSACRRRFPAGELTTIYGKKLCRECRAKFINKEIPTPVSPTPITSRLRDLAQQILDDCRALGLGEEKIDGLYKTYLDQTNANRPSGFRFFYDTARAEFTLEDWERGKPQGGIAAREEKEFRFQFLSEYVYSYGALRLSKEERLEKLLRDTRDTFGDTAGYRAAGQQLESLRRIGKNTEPPRRAEETKAVPAADPNSPYSQYKKKMSGSIHAILYDFTAQDEFFVDLETMEFSPFHPLASFDREWSNGLPTGVFLVNERHSVYQNGECIYRNEHFTGAADGQASDKAPVYTVLVGPSPDHVFPSEIGKYGLWDVYRGPIPRGSWVQPYQKTFDFDRAVQKAIALSLLHETRTAVIRIVDRFDTH